MTAASTPSSPAAPAHQRRKAPRAGLDGLVPYPPPRTPADEQWSHVERPVDRSWILSESGTYRLFFLCSFGRTGTNWLGNILNRHPEVYINGEFNFHVFWHALDEFAGPSYHLGHHEPYASVARYGLEEMLRRSLLQNAREKPGARFLGDRSTRWLIVLLPGAPHIYLARDGRDVAVSFTFHHLRVMTPERHPGSVRELLAGAVERFREGPDKAREVARALLADERWVKYVAGEWAERMRFDKRVFDRSQLPGEATPMLWVRYEDLHADTDAERRRMYEFLGADPDRAEPLRDSARETAGLGREDPYNFFRRGEVGDWRNYATPEFVAHFKAAAGAELINLGYEPNDQWGTH